MLVTAGTEEQILRRPSGRFFFKGLLTTSESYERMYLLIKKGEINERYPQN